MKAMTRGRKYRMRATRTAGEAEVDAEECAWASRVWEAALMADAGAEAETKAMQTGNRCKKY